MTVPYRPLPLDLTDVRYERGPDSSPRPGVPRGSVTAWRFEARAYPGTTRTVWTYVPAGLDLRTAAAVAVVNDGWWYLDPDGDVRGAVVLDNLIASGAVPPTIGVFVDPGVRRGPEPKNRNAEYDAADDRYAGFLVEEVLARVERDHRISHDPARAVVVGGSSGGNAAFTAAWHRPDRFGQAVCFLSSFAQMPSGNPYPRLLARGARRPVRWFLQAAHRDLGWDRPERNWFAENLRVAAALAESGHDVRLVVGDGGHSPQHAGVLLPDALRWALGPCT